MQQCWKPPRTAAVFVSSMQVVCVNTPYLPPAHGNEQGSTGCSSAKMSNTITSRGTPPQKYSWSGQCLVLDCVWLQGQLGAAVRLLRFGRRAAADRLNPKGSGTTCNLCSLSLSKDRGQKKRITKRQDTYTKPSLFGTSARNALTGKKGEKSRRINLPRRTICRQSNRAGHMLMYYWSPPPGAGPGVYTS